MPLTRTLVGPLFICTAGLAVTCGPVAPPTAPTTAPKGFGGAEGEAASGDQCVVPKGDTEPFVVEWDAAKRNKVKQLSGDGVLLAVHSGCGLTFLDGCAVGGGYDDVKMGGDKIADSFDIGSATQLKSRLPIGYFELYGKFQKDDRWTLEYVYADSKKAKANVVKRSELPPQCAQATHYVSRIMLGAYRLRSAAARGGEAGATVNDVGVTLESRSDAETIRQGGEFEKCHDQATPSGDGSCQAIVQIYLREIADDGPPGETASPARVAPPSRGEIAPASGTSNYYDSLGKEGPPSAASGGSVVSDKQYRADLEKAWTAVKKAAKGATADRQLEMYQRFLTDFPVENPYAEKARKEVDRLDAELTRKAEADAKTAAKAATLAMEKEKAERMRAAYETAKNSTASARERLAMWKRFVEAYPGNDNPYLSTAKREITALEQQDAQTLVSTAEPAPVPAAASRAEEIQQPGTNLFWLRCPLGETWNGSMCKGEAKSLTLKAATGACPPGYRLPTRQEIIDILGGCDSAVLGGKNGYCRRCSKSDTCRQMFSIMSSDWFWSSTLGEGGIAWSANFYGGGIDWRNVDYGRNVRCVRSAP